MDLYVGGRSGEGSTTGGRHLPQASQLFRQRLRFLEIFSGAGTLPKAAEAHGFTSASWDTELGPEYDLLKPTVRAALLRGVSRGEFDWI